MTHFIPQRLKQTGALTQRLRPTFSISSPVCLAVLPKTIDPKTMDASRGPMRRTSSLMCLTRYEFSLNIPWVWTESGPAPSPRSGTAQITVVLPWRCVWWRWVASILHINYTFTLVTGLGFIVANVPGLMIGAFAGNRIGAIRDAKGKSVAAVFSELGATQKAEVRLYICPSLETGRHICLDFARTRHKGVGFCPVVQCRICT